MAKMADAWKEYGNAAMVDMMLEILPRIAAEIAAPLSGVKKVTMVADGTGQIGAARMTQEVLDIMAQVPAIVERMTGVDISKMAKV